jgi:Transposase DDE domain
MEDWLHERLVGVAKTAGVIGHRRVVDSTGIADSVITQDTVSLIRSAICRCLRLLDELAPGKALACRVSLARDDCDREGKPEICWASEAERRALVNDLFADACRVIIAGIGDPGLVAEVKLLATVAAQDVEDDGAGGVRIAQRVAAERVISTVDPDARHGHRSRRDRYDGYKLYISVDVDSDLFMAGQASTATTGHGEVLADLLDDDPVAVAEVIGDTHYGSTENRRTLAEDGVELTAPAQPAAAPKGYFSKDAFTIDLEAGTVTCPAGHTATIPTTTSPRRQARFDAGTCSVCPLRDGCTKRAGGRTIDIHRDEELLITARQARWTPEFRDRYRERARVERKNAQLKSRRTKLPWRAYERRTPGSSCVWPPSTSIASAEWPFLPHDHCYITMPIGISSHKQHTSRSNPTRHHDIADTKATIHQTPIADHPTRTWLPRRSAVAPTRARTSRPGWL